MERKIEASFSSLFKNSFNFAKKNIIQILKVSAIVGISTMLFIFPMTILFIGNVFTAGEMTLTSLIWFAFGFVTLSIFFGLINTGCSISMVRQFKETGKISCKMSFKETWKNKWKLLGSICIVVVFNTLIFAIMGLILYYSRMGALPLLLIALPFIFLANLVKSIVDILVVYKSYKVINSYKLAVTIMFKVKGAFKCLILPIAVISGISVIIQNIATAILLVGFIITSIIAMYGLVMVAFMSAKIIDNIEI